MVTSNVKLPPDQHAKYKGADKSLSRRGPEFYGTHTFITTFTTVHHLSLHWPNQPIPLPITLLTGAACVIPGRVKDLSAPGTIYTTKLAVTHNYQILTTNQTSTNLTPQTPS